MKRVSRIARRAAGSSAPPASSSPRPTRTTTRILGIDPGSRVTGFGLIEAANARSRYVTSGCIQVRGSALSQRLKCIFDALTAIIDEHRPDVLAVEQVFVHRNASSALTLGHARGVAVLAGELRSLEVHEYTASQVKLAVTGLGRASKEQVQHMIKVLLCLSHQPPSDAADALAVCVCHAHTRSTLSHIERASENASA